MCNPRWGSFSSGTCLAVCKDANVVAVKRGCDQLSDVAKDLLLRALWSKYPVKLEGLHSRGAASRGATAERVVLPRLTCCRNMESCMRELNGETGKSTEECSERRIQDPERQLEDSEQQHVSLRVQCGGR